MARLTGAKVTVAGAGALGLCIALELARGGAEVSLLDPAAPGDNASGVAAGMLAPAFETALDAASADHGDLLLAARDLWPELAERVGISLDRSGAAYYGEHIGAVAARLKALGIEAGVYGDRVYTREDWRLSPRMALAALRSAAEAAGVRFEQTRAEAPADGALLVLATGAERRGLAAELALLEPIKGHILRLSGGPDIGPVIRGDGIYIVPDPSGAIVGATMERRVDDRTIDAARVAALRAAAEALFPELAELEARAETGIRAATPDGLPMVGPSVTPDVLLAVGARRNGWLLAPLVAQVVAAYVAGDDPGPFAARLDPRRFDRQQG
ncbi:MAG: FAD-dependent oxidoreductase [Caulobacter sp.]|nr:FAD-dependent oxidoreductase [Caulobacter sp.]